VRKIGREIKDVPLAFLLVVLDNNSFVCDDDDRSSSLLLGRLGGSVSKLTWWSSLFEAT